MLYDNAQILELLAFAHAGAPNPLYAARAAETVAWLDRDMRTSGAFAASEDADSEGEEGRFYVWQEADIDALLGARSTPFKAVYDVTSEGNWEGRTILRRLTPLSSDSQVEAQLSADRSILLAARAARVRPGRDDKILVDWNALTIAALCRASHVFDRPDWLHSAIAVYTFLSDLASADGRAPHGWRLGRVTAAGLVDDQATMARAALALFEATGEQRYLADACRFATAARTWFGDADGSFYTTASDATDIPLGPTARPRSVGDNATPSGNGILAEVFARLFHLTGDQSWAAQAEAVIRAFSGNLDALPGSPTLLAAADLLARCACVVIAGPSRLPATSDLLAVALAASDPAVCVLRAVSPDALPAGHPAHGKSAGPTGASAYLCRNQTCSLPIAEPAELRAMLSAAPTRWHPA